MLWNVELYETEGGRIPVKEFLDSLPAKHSIKVAKIINMLKEYGPLLREPHSKRIVDTNLNELRIQASPNIYRVFYFAYIQKRFILLHAFTKKTEQTPRKEIEIAIDRMGNYIRRDKND